MLKPEDIITGEKFQELAGCSISMQEHKEFESQNVDSINIESFFFKNFNNPELVYINSSLINRTKPKLAAIEIENKLRQFKNKFSLILHNSDQDFNPHHIRLLDIPNLQNIYTQNCNVTKERIHPLPIGIANSRWKHGNLKILCSVINTPANKSKNIYYNFTVKGGMRPEYRVPCKQAADALKLPKNKPLQYIEYLKDLQQHKFCLCPSGNGLDTHRLWECLYLKVIPIIVDSTYISHYSKDLPIYLLKKWEDLNLDDLKNYYSTVDWGSYELLKFKNYCKKIELL
jgi:hypothetical protein